MTKGFSLIEVIITITIIGILTGIMIPSYTKYRTSGIDLEVKEKTLVIQNEIMSFMNRQILNNTQKYPVLGSSSTEYLNINNVNPSNLKTFVRGIMTYSQVLDINTFTIITNGEFSGFEDGIGYIEVTINYESKESVICEFKITDNQLNYKDVALLNSITYNDGKGHSYKAMM